MFKESCGCNSFCGYEQYMFDRECCDGIREERCERCEGHYPRCCNCRPCCCHFTPCFHRGGHRGRGCGLGIIAAAALLFSCF